LSAYNLFFSEERERILKEIAKKEGTSDAGGDSEEGEKGTVGEDSDNAKDGEDEEKPKALLRPLIPAEKKRRPHRKTHGKISFQELARMVGERWKSLPDDERKYYQDLAQEDMKRQKVAMEEYYAKQNSGPYNPGDAIKPDHEATAVTTTETAVSEPKSAV
jgi:HMG (high mobility group) box